MAVVRKVTLRNTLSGMLGLLPATIITAMASPMARPMPSTMPAAIPLLAAGTLILNQVSVSVAPRARLPCSYSGGTALRAVTDTDTMLGRIMMDSTTMADSRQAPDALPKVFATAGTSTCMPSRPNTTLGMPLSSSMAVTTTVRTFGPAALDRNTAVSRPTGTPMRVAPSVPYTLDRIKGRMPNFGSAAVEAHSVPSRNRNRPILWMAGTPESHHVHRDEHHAAHRQHPAQEEDEIHHRFQPVGRGAGQPYPNQIGFFVHS